MNSVKFSRIQLHYYQKKQGLLITYYFRKFLMKFINEMETDEQVFSEILKRLQ